MHVRAQTRGCVSRVRTHSLRGKAHRCRSMHRLLGAWYPNWFHPRPAWPLLQKLSLLRKKKGGFKQKGFKQQPSSLSRFIINNLVHPVCERRVNLLVYSLSLHRHSYIGFILAFASSIHNKQTKTTAPILSVWETRKSLEFTVFHYTDIHILVLY